ncbi:MAG: hypothetical protein ABIN08_00450, partial [Caldimonas sp.]
LVPGLASIHHSHHQQHHRDLDEHADDRVPPRVEIGEVDARVGRLLDERVATKTEATAALHKTDELNRALSCC